MLTLHSIPRDILSQILASLRFQDLLQLYCIGDPALTTAFQRITLPPIILVSEINFRYGQLPAFVQNCATQITHFELHAINPLVELTSVTQTTLRSLSNLRTLILHTPYSDLLLTSNDQDELDALCESSRDLFGQLGINTAPKMLNLHKIFPKLEKLHVKSTKRTTITSADFFALRELPLTSLSWDFNLHIDDTILHFLPSTLKHLTLYSDLQLKSSFPSLPPQLETLDWDYSYLGDTPSPESFARLPPSLTELHMVSGPRVVFPSDYLEILPPSLTHLTIVSFLKFEKTAKLPPAISTLQLKLEIPPNDLFRSIIFPISLTKLIIATLPVNFDHELLPASLRSLRSTYVRSDIKKQAPPLPSGLLEFYSSMHHSLEGQWPTGLERLEVQGASVHQNDGKLSLPTTLRYLKCGNMRYCDIQALPDSLTHIHIAHMKIRDATIALKLPPALIHFQAEQIFFSADELNALPKTLMSLIVTDAWPGDCKLDLSECAWPPNLRDLCLSGYKFPVTLEFVSNLPKTVRSLRLQVAFPVKYFSALPADLETFKIESATGDLDAHLRELPRRLKSLSVYHAHLSSKAAVYLPRTLTSLEVHVFKLDRPHLLPVGLRSLRASIDPLRAPHECIGAIKGPYDEYSTQRLQYPDHIKTDVALYPKDSKDPKDRCTIS